MRNKTVLIFYTFHVFRRNSWIFTQPQIIFFYLFSWKCFLFSRNNIMNWWVWNREVLQFYWNKWLMKASSLNSLVWHVIIVGLRNTISTMREREKKTIVQWPPNDSCSFFFLENVCTEEQLEYTNINCILWHGKWKWRRGSTIDNRIVEISLHRYRYHFQPKTSKGTSTMLGNSKTLSVSP